MRIPIKGTIISNSSKWIYDWLDMESTCPRDVETALASAGAEGLDVDINSCGGEIFAGGEIYNLLLNATVPVRIHVVGLAASAASVIMCAGECDIAPTAMVMIHNVSSRCAGDYRDFAHEAEVCDKATESMAQAYVKKTGRDVSEFRALMDRETWMTAQEAVDCGLCDRIAGAGEGGLQLVATAAPVIPNEALAKFAKIKQEWETEKQNMLDDRENLLATMARLLKLEAKNEKAEFEAKLAELKAQAAEALLLGNADESNELMNKAEELENAWHNQCVEEANAAAMSGKALNAEPMKNAAVTVMAAKHVEKMEEKTMNRNEMIASEQYRVAYLQNLQGRTVEGEGMQMLATAKATIPTQTANKIYDFIREDPLLARITMTNFAGNVTLPVDNANADASWVAMGTASTPSSDVVTGVNLAAYKLIKTIEIGADVAGMSVDAFEEWLVVTLGKKMRRALAAAVVNGTGTAQPTGLTNLAVEGSYTKAGMKYKDLLTILASLDQDYAEGACLMMKRTTYYSELAGMVDTAGQPVVVRDVQEPSKMRILDAEVLISQAVTDDSIYYGNPENFVMNLGSDIKVEKDNSVGFLTGSTTYRGMALADGKALSNNAFKKFTRSST